MKVNVQGKAIVEADGAGWLLMLPDGEVLSLPTKAAVEKAVKKYSKQHADEEAINTLITEWRE